MAAKKTKAPTKKEAKKTKPAKVQAKTEKPKAAPKPVKETKAKPTKAAEPKKAVESKVEKPSKELVKTPAKLEAVPAKAEKPAKAPKAEKPAPTLMSKKGEAAEPAPKRRGIAADAPEGLDEEGLKLFKQWNNLREQHKNDRAPMYNLEADFAPKTPLEHKVLGWGYVLKKQNNRIEVLFREGVKILVTNYKP